MKIAAAYVRVSTEEQTELSPDSQVKLIREYAAISCRKNLSFTMTAFRDVPPPSGRALTR